MSILPRKILIHEIINAQGTVNINDLAKQFDVSTMTIRRDLETLEIHGYIKRVHGGAEKNISLSYEPTFSKRQLDSKQIKEQISKQAIRLVKEGDVIGIDSGTTALTFAKHLFEHTHLTIVTPSIHVASLFIPHSTIKVILSGGLLRKGEGSLVGDYARVFFDKQELDMFFLSAAGISAQAGITDYTIEDASIKKIIIKRTHKTVAMMSSDKFNITSFSQVCPLSDINIMISDTEPERTLKKALIRAGTEICISR